MQRRVGPLLGEAIPAEHEKFTAPLLLVHGLWDTAHTWRPFAGYLSHRGWECIAVHLRGRAGSEPVAALADHLADVRAATTALETPPVLVGHDLGALLVLNAAVAARAVVVLAPIVPLPIWARAPSALRGAGSAFARWRGKPLAPPGGRWRGAYPAPAGAIREPAAVVRDLIERPWPVSAVPREIPALVLASEDDSVTPVEAARALAQTAGAEFRLCAGGGHALLRERGWEEHVAMVHRWLVQRLGAPLLAWYEEAADEE